MAVRSILVSILFLLVSKNQNCVFENSREKGSNESFHTLNTLIVLTNNALTFICFQVLRFSPNRKKREREKKSGKKNKTKIREMDNKNPAIWRERCTRARMLLISPPPIHRFAEIYDMAVGIAHKTNFKTVRSANYTERERERDEGMAVAKTIGNRRKINKERMGTKGRGGGGGRRRGSNGRGRTRAIFPLFVFHYSAEGSCPLPAWNIARQ